MLNIQRLSNDGVVFSVSGRIEVADVAELQRLLELEDPNQEIALDLENVTLIERDAVSFLGRCETSSIKLENCPAYIRDWIDAERRNGRSQI